MIRVTCFGGMKIAVFGLGGSGLVTAKALMMGGAEVLAWDDNPTSVERARADDVTVGNLGEVDLSGYAALVLSPGVPLTHPKPHWTVDLAKAAGIPVIGDVELFSRERLAKAPRSVFVAITGTNGKSTTTALVAHVLRQAGCDVQMGGNIGRAVLSLDEPENEHYFVVECSSYQIDLAPGLSPTIGVLLNLAPDHLDRHGTMEHYAQVKERLVAKAERVVIGADDKYCVAIARQLREEGHEVETVLAGGVKDDSIYVDYKFVDGRIEHYLGQDVSIMARLDGIPSLRGAHNGQNASAAFAVCHKLGLSQKEIQEGFNTFPGLAHRMEQVAEKDGILFINDSKATNAEAAATALSSFDDVFWIAGGLPKTGGITSLEPFFGNIHRAFLIGEAAPEFAATLGSKVEFEISGNLDQAVKNAYDSARTFVQQSGKEVAILLSPACASFDQYANFEVRGLAFKDAVAALLAG